MCGVWVALEDVTLAQGRLHYYPGSQRLPHLDYEDLGIPLPPAPFDWNNPLTLPSYLQYEDHIERIVREAGLPRVDLEIRRGSFFVWAAKLHHRGGTRALRKDPRRVPHPAIGRTTWRAQTVFRRPIPMTLGSLARQGPPALRRALGGLLRS
jgi:ectoine hydroxylase-related dioxygenase (phytanoyl-CoA dioxygenase family)